MDFPIAPEFWWSTDILLIIKSSTGMDQEIHPSRCFKGWQKMRNRVTSGHQKVKVFYERRDPQHTLFCRKKFYSHDLRSF